MEIIRGEPSVRLVLELLGHSSINTTQIYTHVVIDDLQKSHSRTAPGNRCQEAAFIPFNSKTAAWRQDKKRRKKQWQLGAERLKSTEWSLINNLKDIPHI